MQWENLTLYSSLVHLMGKISTEGFCCFLFDCEKGGKLLALNGFAALSCR